jgi:acyl-CoA thioesterase II
MPCKIWYEVISLNLFFGAPCNFFVILGDDEHLHHCVAAFISDVAPVGTPLFAHAGAGFKLGMAASLDHTMWIHRPDFRIDEDWLLYETESTIAGKKNSFFLDFE